MVGEDPVIANLRVRQKGIDSQLEKENSTNGPAARSIDDLPWTRRDPTRVADKAALSGMIYRRRDGIVRDEGHARSSGQASDNLPVGGKTISTCEQRLMRAMDELADPLKSVRDLCRK